MATSAKWKERIKESCKLAGTYNPCFEDVIDTLSQILENRDKAQKAFEKDGSKPLVERWHGTKVNLVKNPALAVINECNAQALTFWKELGLTAKAFQAMQNNGFKKPEASLEDLLKKIGT